MSKRGPPSRSERTSHIPLSTIRLVITEDTLDTSRSNRRLHKPLEEVTPEFATESFFPQPGESGNVSMLMLKLF